MLTVENLSAGYARVPVLQDIRLEVKAGEWLGLIGPNGCGKTTLLRVLSGVIRPARGKVLLEGRELREYPPRALAKLRACLPQELPLEFPFTVREIALLGRSPHIPALGAETPDDLRIAEEALRLTDLSSLAGHAITQISGGERQRAFIALCLAQEPKLLLLDEPTSHLDATHQLSILNLLRDLNQKKGLTLITVFHDLNLASEYCGRLAVLGRGRLEIAGTPDEVITPERLGQIFGAGLRVGKNPHSGKPHVFF